MIAGASEVSDQKSDPVTVPDTGKSWSSAPPSAAGRLQPRRAQPVIGAIWLRSREGVEDAFEAFDGVGEAVLGWRCVAEDESSW